VPTSYRILVSDPLHASGLEALRQAGHEVVELPPEERPTLPAIIGGFDALIVRSGTKVSAGVLAAGAPRLKVVGRAGIGVDNIDVAAATEHGILVVNAPTANLLSATEHTFALLLALVRRLPEADRSMKEGRWERKRLVGTELQGKTLGVIGFGRIGQRVARRAQAFDMSVLAYDPFLDPEAVRKYDAEPLELDELLGRSDFVTIHTPLTKDTRNLLDADRLGRMKEGACLINCGRGGVVDEAALLAALDDGRLAGAGLDVFSQEPPSDYALARHPKVVATPHLGASTREAQVRVATDAVRMVLAALDGSLAVTAVNLPFRPAGRAGEPYLRLAETLGRLASGLQPSAPRAVRAELWGIDDALHVPLSVAVLKGVLAPHLGEAVNYVNAERLAQARGVEVVRAVHSAPSDYPTLVAVRLTAQEGEVEVAGTLFHGHDPRVVRLDEHQLEFRPKDRLLVVRNRDVPGVVGKLGTVLGDAGVNIAEIHLSRLPGSDQALSVVRLDQPPADATLEALLALEPVRSVRLVDLGAG